MANEDGLRALGDHLDGARQRVRSRPTANETGLQALADQMRRAETAPVANEAGLLALGEEIRRSRRPSSRPAANGSEPAAAVPAAAVPAAAVPAQMAAPSVPPPVLPAAPPAGGELEAVHPASPEARPDRIAEAPDRVPEAPGGIAEAAEPGTGQSEAAVAPGFGGAPLPSEPAASGNDAGADFVTEPRLEKVRHRHARPRTRHARLRRGLVIGLVVVLVLVAGGVGYVYYLTHDLNRIHVAGLEGALVSGKEAGTENILMVGSTSRCALKVQNPAYGLCSQGVNGVNSDVIMILHADPAHHRLAILSVPRDLFVPNARSEGPNKIDAALFEGVSQLVASIQDDFGIPIQHTVTLNFDQFANVVDALGGIDMSFPMSVFDAESGLNVQAAACVHLNGTQALAVVRARHLQYRTPTTESANAFYWPHENLSDLARIRRDHEFLRVLGAAAAKKGLGDPITDLNLINSVRADLTFDQDWAVTDMANLVLDFHSVDPNKVPQLTLPVSVVVDPSGAGGGLLYRGSSYGDAEFPAAAQDQAVVDQVLGIDPATDSMTGHPLPAPASVAVSVVDGSGTGATGTSTAAALGALGFRASAAGELQPRGDVSETFVYYGSRSPAAEGAAEAVTRSMSGAVIMAYDPTQVAPGSEVTVVTGTDFAVNPPAPPSTPSTAASGAASTAAPTSAVAAPAPGASSTAAVQSPSAPTSNLQPWDPRACPPGAVPTAPVANET